jgi:putative ABC transport system ATP-binding protein
MTSIDLRARGLVKRFGQTTALDGVDFAASPGESVAIMGASGSGKTTLLHALAGIEPPDEGSILLGEPGAVIELTELSESDRSEWRRTRFGFVFQQGMLIPELTAVENVALPLMLGGRSRRDAFASASTLFGPLGIDGLQAKRIGQLSGGQAQRIAIARAQVGDASVVFADEPTGALDSATSGEVLTALLASTTGQGRTLVIVTHDAEVGARCDRIVHIADGRLLAPQVGDRIAATGRA